MSRPAPLLRPARRPVWRHTLATALLALSAGGAIAAAEGSASRYYEDALSRYERQDVAGAIIQLKNALQADRKMLPVHVLLGKALLRNGDPVAAGVALTEALKLGVNRAEVVLPLAHAYIGQGRQPDVLKEPQFALEGLPPALQREMLVLRSAASADVGDTLGAMRAIDAARAIDARSVDVWLAEVPVRIRARQFAEAGVAVERALAIAPAAAETWYQKGSVAHVQGQLQAALAAYARALQLQADHVEARVARAGLLIDLEQPAEAARDIAELQRLAPREPRGAYLKALLAERDGQAAAATAALREVTELIDPVPIAFIRYRPQLLMLNGLAHFGLGEPDKARLYLESFQKVQSHSAASKLLAQIYLSESNADRAVEVLESYLNAQPTDAQALTLLAAAHRAKGRSARATTLMQDAVRRSDTPALRAALGLSLVDSGQGGEALPELEAAFKRDPSQTQAGAALARLYLRSNQAGKAVATAESLVKRQPANAGYFDLLGAARARAGNTAGARSAFEQAVKLDPKLVQPQLNLARLDMAAKAHDAAAARLGALLQADEKNIDVLLDMALLSGRRGRPDDAQRWLEKATDHAGPRELRPGLTLIDLHLRDGRAGAALEVAKKLSIKGPENVDVLMALGRAQLASADPVGARTSLKNATRLAEYDAPLQVEIALLQLGAANPEGATYSLEKALSGRPDHLPAQALLTDIELRRGDTAPAEARARQIVQKHPKLALGHGLLGDVALARGQGAAALDAYRRAHQIQPSSDTLLRLFRTLSAQQQTPAALQLAQAWTQTHPRDLAVRRALADGHASSGNFKAARVAYEALLARAPTDAAALNNLANVLHQLKDPGALAMAERALAADPANPVVIDTVGWLSHLAGQTDRALQLLRDARLREPGNPEIRYHLAVVLAQAGRKTEAREELESALAAGQRFDSVAEAESLLKTVR